MAKKIEASGLEWALDQLVEQPRQPGEFTIAETHAKSPGKRYAAITGMLYRLEKEGKVTKRQVTINRAKVNLYRKA